MKKLESFLSRKGIPIAIFSLIFGIIIIILFLFIDPFNDWSFNPDSELFARYGDFIGGFIGTIFSLVATLLIYNTLVAQKDTLQKQDELLSHQKQIFEIEQFEATMFNILKIQREIREDINAYIHTLDNDFKKTTYQALGKDFFFYAKNELYKIWLSIDGEQYLGHYDEDYIEILQHDRDELYDPNSRSFTHPDDARIEEQKWLKDERVKYANTFYGISKEKWEKLNKMDTEKRLKSIYSSFFQKYHYAIGHYYRHLFHILKFASDFQNTNKGCDNISKKYVDFVQAQMSSFELTLLFYNSLSSPRLLDLLVQYNFLDNLAEEELVLKSHNCFEKMKLKKRKELTSTSV